MIILIMINIWKLNRIIYNLSLDPMIIKLVSKKNLKIWIAFKMCNNLKIFKAIINISNSNLTRNLKE